LICGSGHQKKSLKILKGLSEAINRLKIMAKRKKDNGTNNDLQNTTQNTDYRVTGTPLKSGGEIRCAGRVVHKKIFSEQRQMFSRSLFVLSFCNFIGCPSSILNEILGRRPAKLTGICRQTTDPVPVLLKPLNLLNACVSTIAYLFVQ